MRLPVGMEAFERFGNCWEGREYRITSHHSQSGPICAFTLASNMRSRSRTRSNCNYARPKAGRNNAIASPFIPCITEHLCHVLLNFAQIMTIATLVYGNTVLFPPTLYPWRLQQWNIKTPVIAMEGKRRAGERVSEGKEEGRKKRE